MIIGLGQPRNGTSLLMRVLAFGGIEVEYDKGDFTKKHAVFGNPHGFFETSKQGDKCHKVWNWLQMLKLPQDTKYVYIERDIEQVIKSWQEIEKRGGGKVDLIIKQAQIENNREQMRKLLQTRPHIIIKYDDLQLNPRQECERIRDFVKDEVDFDVDNAVKAVDKSLYAVR